MKYYHFEVIFTGGQSVVGYIIWTFQVSMRFAFKSTIQTSQILTFLSRDKYFYFQKLCYLSFELGSSWCVVAVYLRDI